MVVQQVFAPYWINAARANVLEQFQEQRKSRVIAMIRRQETISLFGVPVSNYINIEDSEAVLRAIRLTPPEQSIDMILHTPGGLVLAAEQIAKALVEHKGKVTTVATVLTEGRWTHDFPITVQLARELGLSLSTDMPRIVYDLMDLFPQGGADRPSVMYVPLRRSPGGPCAREGATLAR